MIVISAKLLAEINEKKSMKTKNKKKVILNEVLRNLMADRKMTVKELSKIAEIPQSTVSSYLGGTKASYDPNHLSSIAEVFQVSLDHLLYGENLNISKTMHSLLTEEVFDGFLKVKIERVIK